jgi:hypothetical protein
MKTPSIVLVLLAIPALTALADSSIDSTDRYAYGANIGWTNWKHDTGAPEGALIGLNFCSGDVYGANVGWIDLGDGIPANGTDYQNNSASDFGVNVTSIDLTSSPPVATLEGYAYGANIGWINFEQAQGKPMINLSTGEFIGHAYSANCGWINLANGVPAALKTGSLDQGLDTDGDNIPDWWELTEVDGAGMTTGSQAGDLALLDDATDSDGDGTSDLDEFAADTNPFESGDVLRIFDVAATAAPMDNIDLEWTSEVTRKYDILSSTDLASFSLDLADIIPDAGGTTARTFTDSPLGTRKFWRVRAKLPLSP